MNFNSTVICLVGLGAAAISSACSPGAPGGAARAQGTESVRSPNAPWQDFRDYWYQGKAELTSYELEQARYGEVHSGHAVLIYVTEDFSNSKQVKLDDPSAAGSDATKVLKLNFTKKFNTGVYPYSMMSSIFTPVDHHIDTLKVTTSSQEWCGHTFTQLNRVADGYRVEQKSYFESEGDSSMVIAAAILEDDLWNTIRLDPDALPLGKARLIPSTMYLRLRHGDFRSEEAETRLEAVAGVDGLLDYTIDYPALGRTLSIRFRRDFPHEIEGWEESYDSGWGTGRQRLTTRATKKERMMLDYWRRNRAADESLRTELGLPD